MAKYKVLIPSPSAKRLTEKLLSIVMEDGWGFYNKQIHPITDKSEFVFDVEDDIKCAFQSTCMDAPTFKVFVDFSNISGSRKETVRLVPVKELE